MAKTFYNCNVCGETQSVWIMTHCRNCPNGYHKIETQKELNMDRIEPRYPTSSPLLAAQMLRDANEPKLELPMPKPHWTKELREDNRKLKASLAYLRFQMRVIVQSRFDKYRNAKDSETTMAYRKCATEIDNRVNSAICVSQEILDDETQWDVETASFIN